MHGHKKRMSEYIARDDVPDTRNWRRNTKRKNSQPGASETVKRSQWFNQTGSSEVEYMDTTTTVRPIPNVYLSEETRMTSRNGLTPRMDVVETAMEKGIFVEKQDIGDSTEHNKLKVELSPAPIYSCEFCGARFNIKSLLSAHRRTHADDFKARYLPRRICGTTALPVNGHQCKFCDRKFDLERTLHIHQLCHCKKIPPATRRKLGYTELLHEKKAPLPAFHKHPYPSIRR